MPICPGCEQQVSYDRLDVHQRYCDGIWGADAVGGSAAERLEHRLVSLEDLERQLVTLEKRLDARLEDLERRWTARGATSRE